MSKIERTIDELYADDPERADAVVFGRRAGVDRRGFLGGAGLAAMGAAVGGAIPFSQNMPAGLIPGRARASVAVRARGRPKGPQYLNFPGKDGKARSARRQAAGRGDAGRIARRRDHAVRKILRPQQRTDSGRSQRAGQVGNRDRRRGQQAAQDHARRIEIEIQAADHALRAGMRRQRPLRVQSAGARQSMDQWRRRLRGMDRRAARRCAQDRGREIVRHLHRALCRRSASLRRRDQADLVARRAHRESDGPEHPDRLGDERAAAAEYPWRAGAADLSRLGRIGVAEMADQDHHSRQGA